MVPPGQKEYHLVLFIKSKQLSKYLCLNNLVVIGKIIHVIFTKKIYFNHK